MSTSYSVGYFVGSIAKASINRTLSNALIRLAPAELTFKEIPIANLPIYSYDYDSDYPPEGRALKEAIASVQAILFVTPEYNRSIPGGLKNAIDWASRPWGQNSFARKPSAVIGASPGAIGTAVAQQSLRSVLSFCNSPQMNSPEAYISFKPGCSLSRARSRTAAQNRFCACSWPSSICLSSACSRCCLRRARSRATAVPAIGDRRCWHAGPDQVTVNRQIG